VAAATRTPRTALDAEQIEFLEGLIDPPRPMPLGDASTEDRWFLAGIRKRWHARQLELPVLSDAAIRLTGLLRSEAVSTARFVQLIESDPALTIEVLRSANAAACAGAQPVRSLDDAIRRIGLRRLGSLLIMAQLNKKILKTEANKAALLMDLAPPLGIIAGLLAAPEHGDTDIAFTRGSLLHVEHMVILGAVAEVSRDHRQPVRPSVRALLQACQQFGPEIRHAVANAWKLQHVLLGETASDDFAPRYSGYCRAVISRWLNRPLPELTGVDCDRLKAVIAHIGPRTDAAPLGEAPAEDGGRSELQPGPT
jgi:HD-like signal output (HDOD) protein